MTKRAGRSAANDEVLAAVVNAGTPVVCLVGKTHDFHVRTALGIPLEENLANIAHVGRASSSALGREAIFDAEHFFDGWQGEPGLCARLPQGGARRGGALGGALRHQRRHAAGGGRARSPAAVIAAGVPGERLGIHTHDDTGNAVADALAAVDAGARQVQGTLNGLGERCGNANLVSLIPTLLLKEPYASPVRDRGPRGRRWPELTRVSRLLDDILNRVPDRRGALCRRLGLHPQGGAACERDPEGSGDLRARAAGGGGERAGHPDVEPGRAVEPARAAGQGRDRGGGGRSAAGGDPRRGEGARGPRLRLRRRLGELRDPGAAACSG